MTTTADKIESLSRRIANLRDEIDECDAELQSIAFESEDTTDREPLECWVNEWSDEIAVYYDDKTAINAALASKAQRTSIHMREVTPQDEQDREDAARYREEKKNKRLRETLFSQIDYPSLWVE